MSDIFDNQFENAPIEVPQNLVATGDDINIMAKDASLRAVMVGVGWDINAFNADAMDLDVSCFLLDKDGQTREDGDFIFYNNMEACAGAITHNGDSRTGAGDGDDESLSIDLQGVPFDVLRIVFVLSVYQGLEKEQNMGMVRGAYIRLVNAGNSHEILRYELSEVLASKSESGMVVAVLDREGPKWHFKPMAEFVPGGLGEVAARHGIIISGE